jgi:hypothetical protein
MKFDKCWQNTAKTSGRCFVGGSLDYAQLVSAHVSMHNGNASRAPAGPTTGPTDMHVRLSPQKLKCVQGPVGGPQAPPEPLHNEVTCLESRLAHPSPAETQQHKRHASASAALQVCQMNSSLVQTCP